MWNIWNIWNKLKEKHPVAYEVSQWGILALAIFALAVSIVALKANL